MFTNHSIKHRISLEDLKKRPIRWKMNPDDFSPSWRRTSLYQYIINLLPAKSRYSELLNNWHMMNRTVNQVLVSPDDYITLINHGWNTSVDIGVKATNTYIEMITCVGKLMIECDWCAIDNSGECADPLCTINSVLNQ